MFLLIILFGLAAFGLVFALYMQADLPAASHAQTNPPANSIKVTKPAAAAQHDPAATPAAGAASDAGISAAEPASAAAKPADPDND